MTTSRCCDCGEIAGLAPLRTEHQAEITASHLAEIGQLPGESSGSLGRNGVAESVLPAAGITAGAVDSHHLTLEVDERSARHWPHS